MLRPLFMFKVGRHRSCRHDKEVVGQLAAVELHDTPPDVDPANFPQKHLHVALASKDPANRRPDVTRREGSRRHPVQQGLKEVVVATVEQRDPQGCPFQAAHHAQPTESRADDDNVGTKRARVPCRREV